MPEQWAVRWQMSLLVLQCLNHCSVNSQSTLHSMSIVYHYTAQSVNLTSTPIRQSISHKEPKKFTKIHRNRTWWEQQGDSCGALLKHSSLMVQACSTFLCSKRMIGLPLIVTISAHRLRLKTHSAKCTRQISASHVGFLRSTMFQNAAVSFES